MKNNEASTQQIGNQQSLGSNATAPTPISVSQNQTSYFHNQNTSAPPEFQILQLSEIIQVMAANKMEQSSHGRSLNPQVTHNLHW